MHYYEKDMTGMEEFYRQITQERGNLPENWRCATSLVKQGRNYTPPKGGALRPAGGVSAAASVGAELTSAGRHAPCGKQMIPRNIPVAVNHHRGRYASPALAAASYPFVDLSPGNALLCKPFPDDKFKIYLFPISTFHSIM